MTADLVERIWARDATVWTGGDEAQWLGWLDEPQRMLERVHWLLEFATAADYDDVVDVLEQEGVQKFADSFEELLEGVRAKRDQLVTA